MKAFLVALACLFIAVAFSQTEETDPVLLDIGKTNLVFGLNQGSHPNLISGKLNVHASVESAITVKNIPLNLSGRFSTEKFISGKPAFFRLSYDGSRRKGMSKRELEGALVAVNETLGGFQDSLYKLEGQLAYWQLKKEQFEQTKTAPFPSIDQPVFNLPDLGTGTLSTGDSLKLNGTGGVLPFPGVHLPGAKGAKMDSLDSFIANLNQHYLHYSQQKDSLLQLKQDYTNKLNSIDYRRPLSIPGGIDRLDLGLTSTSGGSLSHNTIPIQGIHVKGKYRNSFYDAAAGTTVPNRLFSNSVFDQLTNNTQNIFNLNQLYTVNSSRFISSVIVGYGNPEKNSVSVENYYNGRELQAIFSKTPRATNLTSNLSGTWCFGERWGWDASIGKTFKVNDSVTHSLEEELAISIGTRYQLKRMKSQIYAKAKRIGTHYDGYSQGLYNSGYSKQEVGISSRLTKQLNTQLIFVRQVFSRNSLNFTGMRTSSASLDVQWNVTRNWMLYGGYTLLNASGFDTLAQGINHLGKGGFTWLKNRKTFRSQLSGLAAYSNVQLIDSNLRLVNASIHGSLDWRILGGGLQVSVQDYTGIAAIYGTNWIIKPELRIHHKGFSFSAAYQLLYSEQFGRQSGFSCRILASPSEHLTWEITGAKWLPTEALYIPLFHTERFIPYYFDLKLRVFLNRNKL